MEFDESVPIRLEIAIGQQQQYQDTFCWSGAASREAAESFAAELCRDNQLPHAAIPAIVSAIQQQVNVARSHTPAVSHEAQAERNEVIK